VVLSSVVALAGCCRWCERWCPECQHPAAVAAVPAQPCCVPCCPPTTTAGCPPGTVPAAGYQPAVAVPGAPAGFQRNYAPPATGCVPCN